MGALPSIQSKSQRRAAAVTSIEAHIRLREATDSKEFEL